MFIKTSIDIKKFSEYLDENLGLCEKSKSGRIYLPVNHSISLNYDMNGNNVKSSVFNKNNKAEPLFFGTGRIDPIVIIQYAEQLKSQGYGKVY